jgi:predicted nuclease of predicted toxin-antitoxin system
MKFLCDVHISYKLVNNLVSLGFECIHVNGILNKWHTTDSDICAYADKNEFVIITKDSDFKDSFLIKGVPKKLIKINLGNISNADLIQIITNNIDAIVKLEGNAAFLVEIDKLQLNYIIR